MQILRELTGGDWDTEALLTAALAAAPRVAVKRPTKAPWLANRKPAMSLSSAQVRFDLYLSTTHIDRPASD
jgi:16S rRNA (guanine1516-N2)-methyltransferase